MDYSKLSTKTLKDLQTGKAIDFSKLTDDELGELKKIIPGASQEPEAPGMLTSAGLGAAQGATFGFADEAEAGVRSMVQDKTYDDLIKDVRNRYKTAEETNPGSFMAGELAGGIAVPMGGVGVAAKGASTAARLANLAGAGAIAGAATSLGTREDDKLTGQAALDAGKGAAVGAGLSAALGSAIPAAAKYIGKKVKGSEVGQDVADVYNKIRSGEVETFDRAKLPEFSEKVRDAAKTDIMGNLDKMDDYKSAGYKAIYDQAEKISEQSGGKIPVQDIVNEIRMKMPKAELQGVDATDINKLNKNLASMTGEEELAYNRLTKLDPEEAKAKVTLELQRKAASGEVTAERNAARNLIKGRIRDELKGLGLEGESLNKATEREFNKLKSTDIDEAVEEVRALSTREKTQYPPEFEVNPETGLEVGTVKRIDSDLTLAVPQQKMEKVKDIIQTRGEVSPKELSGYVNNIQKLYDSAQNPQYKALLLDAKSQLEKALRSGVPEDFNTAKRMLSDFYREVLDAKSANLKLPANFDTSAEGRKAYGQGVDSMQRMIGNYSKKEGQDAQNLNEFFDKLKGVNAEEVGLASSGKTGPASIDDIKGNLQNVSRNYDLAKKAASQSSLAGASTGIKGAFDKLQMSARAKMLGTAESAAHVADAASKTYEKTVGTIQHYTPEMLTNLATKVKDSGLANILNKAATAPDAKRKALIFTLMQQPAYREAINTANEPETEH